MKILFFFALKVNDSHFLQWHRTSLTLSDCLEFSITPEYKGDQLRSKNLFSVALSYRIAWKPNSVGVC